MTFPVFMLYLSGTMQVIPISIQTILIDGLGPLDLTLFILLLEMAI